VTPANNLTVNCNIQSLPSNQFEGFNVVAGEAGAFQRRSWPFLVLCWAIAEHFSVAKFSTLCN
jgi:hypothetical protein